MRHFCSNESIPADGTPRSYLLGDGTGLSRYRQGYLAVDLDVGAGTEQVALALQTKFEDDGDWFDVYVLDLTPRLLSASGEEIETVDVGAYLDLFVDHADATDWARAFSPQFVVDPGVRAIVQDENSGNFTVRLHNDGDADYGYGGPTDVQVQWERWGLKAQESDSRGNVASVILTADTQASVARILDFYRYLRLRVTNDGANAATLTAGFYS